MMKYFLLLTQDELITLSKISFYYMVALKDDGKKREANRMSSLVDILLSFAQNKPRKEVVAEKDFHRLYRYIEGGGKTA